MNVLFKLEHKKNKLHHTLRSMLLMHLVVLAVLILVYFVTLIACFIGKIIALRELILADAVLSSLPVPLSLPFILDHLAIYLSSIFLSGSIAIISVLVTLYLTVHQIEYKDIVD